MKILLFGKNGQLGWELQRSLAPLGELIALGSGDTSLCGDLANLKGLAETVRTTRPDIIVNAAAYTAVDKAESEPDRAALINTTAPEVLAREARQMGALLVHYSTDYVFDGQGETPWRETDAPAPLNIYGKTKLAGEQALQASGCRHLILRSSWIYATRGQNFIHTMLRLAQERDSLNVIDDQIGAPTGADLIADVTSHILRIKAPQTGLYHLAAAGQTSWYDYTRFIMDFATQAGMKLKAGPDGVTPIPTQAYPTPAKRPLNSRLDTAKIRQEFGLYLPAWQTGAARALGEILGR